ncbi:mechanosensitive ion channel family protein [Pantoea sp. 18069]|uniref:mechanosensitive ion channel family protein n=1 Tax=Pantoea sp. 18069 TaxID=2681415 RepID=UPI0013594E8A|nr:mechanosensitive ion channel family protein [Pantoea sp. 18069]
MQSIAGLVLLALLAVASRYLAQFLLQRVVRRVRLGLAANWAEILLHDKVLRRLAQTVPWLVVQIGMADVPHLPARLHGLLLNLAIAVSIVLVLRTFNALLDAMNDSHDRKEQLKLSTHSIKSYVQLGKLLAVMIAAVLIMATLLDRSPLLLLSGLGAMSAVLMLVFKDTILSFTAGVQLGSNDMIRVGDWVEMPQVGADGFVIDIALNIVKVQNWDKTITTIPTWKLMSDSFKNWRGMSQSGVRRIRRALRIDADTIRVLDATQLEQLSRIALLQNFLAEKRAQTAALPASALAQAAPFHPLQLTNLELLRAYAYAYLQVHPGISREVFMLARTLEPTAEGVPLELYCYTSTSVWVEYEGIQGSIFDHLIGVLPEFGLRLYQRPSGSDVLSGLRPLAQGSLAQGNLAQGAGPR